MSDIIGPALPPHMQKKKGNESEDCIQNSKEREEKSKIIGSKIGPALPPWMTEKDNSSFGPTVPPNIAIPAAGSVPPSSTENDEPVIGPLPPTDDDDVSTVADDIEERSKRMRDRLLGLEKPTKLEREEWMTELPPLLQGFGGGPRKFRAHEREIGDRSVWTDTPADKARKKQGGSSNPQSDQDRVAKEAQSRRDREIADVLSKTKDTGRKESLMSMHEKERKRKAKELEESGEAKIRRPFDRDTDLQANKFDEAAKKRMMKQSQGLSSRFSSGSTTAKFL